MSVCLYCLSSSLSYGVQFSHSLIIRCSVSVLTHLSACLVSVLTHLSACSVLANLLTYSVLAHAGIYSMCLVFSLCFLFIIVFRLLFILLTSALATSRYAEVPSAHSGFQPCRGTETLKCEIYCLVALTVRGFDNLRKIFCVSFFRFSTY